MTRRIIEAGSPETIAIAGQLLEEYAASLEVDLDFQNFAGELAGLPGDYRRPEGALLLGFEGGDPVGCVAFRRQEPGAAEMKRLYVRPSARGGGWGPRVTPLPLGVVCGPKTSRGRCPDCSFTMAS